MNPSPPSADKRTMISVDEALSLIAERAEPLPTTTAGLRTATGRYLAAPVSASHDSPPFDTSAMDGYALRSADVATPPDETGHRLARAGEILAGRSEHAAVRAGEAWRINTGAPLPEGADAVVRIEDTQTEDESVVIRAAASPGLNIRRRGEDFRAGQTLLRPGLRLTPPHIALLASLGIDRVAVRRPPRVALLVSGDELVEPGRPLRPGQIYNSNGPMLRSALEAWGAEVHELGTVGDDVEQTRRALSAGLELDLLVTTGGVSMGSHDFIRPTLLDLGAEEIFWKIRQRPGKPLFFAGRGRTLCFGLPGNPVSSFMTALLYVRPALLALRGASDCSTPWAAARAAEPFERKPGLTVFARVVCEGESASPPTMKPEPAYPPQVRSLDAQGSHQITGLAAADGIVRIDEGEGEIARGDAIPYLAFRGLTT